MTIENLNLNLNFPINPDAFAFNELGFMPEYWEDIYIDGEITKYSVSDLGRVRNNEKEVLLKTTLNGLGYLYVGINLDNGKPSKTCLVHRLVAEAFVPVLEEVTEETLESYHGLVVDHIDANPSNSNIANLRWMTQQENTAKGQMKHFSFINEEGLIITGTNLVKLCSEHNLMLSAMDSLSRGKEKSFNGWKLNPER